MADGVFNTNFGDQLRQAILQRYQMKADMSAQQQHAQLEQQKMRGEMLGRLTLSGSGGQQAPASVYLQALNSGSVPPGTLAQPTPAFAAAGRDTTQRDIAGAKDTEAKKQMGVKLMQQWGAQLPPGKSAKASDFMPAVELQQYGLTGEEKVGSAQKSTTPGKGGAGKTPEEKQLAALKVEKDKLLKENEQILKQTFGAFGDTGKRKSQIATRMPELDKQIQDLENKMAGGAGSTHTPESFSTAWAAAKKGDKVIGPDGVAYEKQ